MTAVRGKSGVYGAGKSEGVKIRYGTKKVSVSLINNFFFESNFFFPGQVAVFFDFDFVVSWRKVYSVVGGSDEAVVDMNRGRSRSRGSRKESGGGKDFIFKIGPVASNEKRNR